MSMFAFSHQTPKRMRRVVNVGIGQQKILGEWNAKRSMRSLSVDFITNIANECSFASFNAAKSPRAPRGPLFQRGHLGPLLSQRRDREDFISRITSDAEPTMRCTLRQ